MVSTDTARYHFHLTAKGQNNPFSPQRLHLQEAHAFKIYHLQHISQLTRVSKSATIGLGGMVDIKIAIDSQRDRGLR